MTKFIKTTIALAFAALLVGCNKPEKEERVSTGSFFMFTVDVEYKGKPFRIQYPVGCSYHLSKDLSGDNIVEGASLSPSVFGKETPDGGALVVKTPVFCDYEKDIDAGKVPSTYNPLIVHYEDAEKPWFGLGYYSAKAFTQPISKMKFISSKTVRITAQEFSDWRKENSTANWVTYERLHHDENPFNDKPWKPGKKYMASVCRGAYFIQLPESVSLQLEEGWKQDGKPKYWAPGEKQRGILINAAKKPLYQRDWNKPLTLFGGHPHWAYGGNGNQFKPESYPAQTDFDINNVDQEGNLNTPRIFSNVNKYVTRSNIATLAVRSRILKKPELEGFFYCNSHDSEYMMVEDQKRIFGNIGGLYFLNNEELNGQDVPHPYHLKSSGAFEGTANVVYELTIKFTGMGWTL